MLLHGGLFHNQSLFDLSQTINGSPNEYGEPAS